MEFRSQAAAIAAVSPDDGVDNQCVKGVYLINVVHNSEIVTNANVLDEWKACKWLSVTAGSAASPFRD